MTDSTDTIYPDADTTVLPPDTGKTGRDDTIGDNTANPNASSAPVSDQVIPSFKVVVWFDFVKGEFRDKQRVVLNGVVDIRNERDLINVEGLIREQLGFDRVFITNWRSLEG